MDINKDKEIEFGPYIKSHYYYDPDHGKIFGIKRQKEVGFLIKGEKYKKISIFKPHYKHKKINFLFSRVCWFLHYGEWPKDQIDHINLDRSDNRIENLRVCSYSENMCNREKLSNNSTGYKGVCWSKFHNKYKVTIAKNKVQIHGGYFTDIDEAVKKSKELRKQYHGDFCRG